MSTSIILIQTMSDFNPNYLTFWSKQCQISIQTT